MKNRLGILISLFSFFCLISLKPLISKNITYLLHFSAPWGVIPYDDNPFLHLTTDEFVVSQSIQKLKSFPANSTKQAHIDPIFTIPKNYDPRYDKCLQEIHNEGRCKSSYAFAVADTLANRYCLKNRVMLELSTQQVLSCSKNYGCDGGYLYKSFEFAERYGIVTEDCLPYSSYNGEVMECPSTCRSRQPMKPRYRCIGGSVVDLSNNIIAIKQELIREGPVSMVMIVYEDFAYYSKGIYKHVYGHELGYQSVRCVGFGYDDTEKEYWICANSWGTTWGMLGWFFIGERVGEIESEAYSCLPDKPY